MNERRILGELYGFGIEELPEKSAVDGRGNLGMTDFEKKMIVVPGFGGSLRKLARYGDGVLRKYAEVAQAVQDYVLGHELQVEVLGRPQDEMQHSRMEQRYLESLRSQGDTMTYLTGLALHRKRLKYGDSTRFSKNIAGYVRKWTGTGAYSAAVGEIGEAIGVLLGRDKPVQGRYAHGGI
jgi:hypothetical protein